MLQNYLGIYCKELKYWKQPYTGELPIFVLRASIKIACSFVTILMAKLNIDFRTSITRVGAATLALGFSQIYNNLSYNTGTKLKVISSRTLNNCEAITSIFIYVLIALKRPIFLSIFIILSSNAQALSINARLKDIVKFEGIRDNTLVGYGLVVGLNGTGDNLSNTDFTKTGLTDFLSRMGVNVKGATIKTKNIAAVTITASLPAFARHGSKIDVLVSTIGDAKSLEGGTLLVTPLIGADGQTYVLAQGQISIGGFTATGNSGTTVNKGVSTNGFIANGGIVEKEVGFELDSMDYIKISLNNPDISTSITIAKTINSVLDDDLAKSLDPSTVQIRVPDEYSDKVVELLSKIENIEVTPDTAARIIIEEASGTIVIGENVRISPVAIAQGNLTIAIQESSAVSQPNPFAPTGSQTVTTPQTSIMVDQGKKGSMSIIGGEATLSELVNGLNSLGVAPRDLITILQNIKAAGALQADIETR